MEVQQIASLADFQTIIDARRSYRMYDTTYDMPEEIVANALEAALLSPNSSNMQMWEFVRVRSTDMKEKMHDICLGQSAAKSASEFVVVVARANAWKERAAFNYQSLENEYGRDSEQFKKVSQYYGKLMPFIYRNDYFGIIGGVRKLITGVMGLFKPTVHQVSKKDILASIHGSNSLAAMTFMYAMKAQGYDTCPLGGFDSKRLKKLLKLKSSDEVTMVITCGKGVAEGVWGKRHRVAYNEVVRSV
ncbi:nitroreductase family protein [Sediminitomix flava]|uniref:Nitroreductase n=1 Tax=Sediminitomix flava TaxID=379075 RepID=A0A315ZC76_SEDFL|nr:nitroreductase family protein [Sediminitomix flava]PWJ43175.1 nitroreductase [Sediminitomix flava]